MKKETLEKAQTLANDIANAKRHLESTRSYLKSHKKNDNCVGFGQDSSTAVMVWVTPEIVKKVAELVEYELTYRVKGLEEEFEKL